VRSCEKKSREAVNKQQIQWLEVRERTGKIRKWTTPKRVRIIQNIAPQLLSRDRKWKKQQTN